MSTHEQATRSPLGDRPETSPRTVSPAAHNPGEHHESEHKRRLKGARDEIMRRGRTAAQDARERINRMVRESASAGMDSAKQGCDDVCAALNNASKTLKERDDRRSAAYVSAAADGVKRASTYIDDRSPGDIADDAAGIIRRNPAVSLGGLFAVGLLAGRFLRASAPEEPEYGGSAEPYRGHSDEIDNRPAHPYRADPNQPRSRS